MNTSQGKIHQSIQIRDASMNFGQSEDVEWN